MININTVRVLIIDESPNDAEQTLNVMRNASLAVRPKQIILKANLNSALDNQTWDLCISRLDFKGLPTQEVISTIERYGKDIPIIVTTKEINPSDNYHLLRAGAKAIIQEHDHELILLTIKKELDNLATRRNIKVLEQSLREIEKRYQLLLLSSREAIAYIHDGMHIYANPAYATLFGFTNDEELVGVPILDIISKEDRADFKKYSKQYQNEAAKAGTFECLCHRDDNSEFQAELAMSPAVYHEEQCTQIIVRIKTDEVKLSAHALQLSEQDLMTGLYNRQYFIGALDNLMTEVTKSSHNAHMLYIEIADFNDIKHRLGLGESDLIISDVADCIKRNINNKEYIISRYYDDVFTILLPNTNTEDSLALAEKIYDTLDNNISEVAEKSIHVHANIGCCQITELSTSSQDLLSQAYNACVKARSLKEKRIKCFEGVSKEQATSDKELVNHIQKALAQGNFQLLFQPLVNLHGENKEYYEVQLRMVNNEGKTIRPDEFFQVADHAGLMTKIDRWVILQATKMLAEHRLNGHNTYLFIKLSLQSLSDETLLPWVSAALKNVRLPPDAVVFQYSETDAATHLKDVKQLSCKLQELHCQTAIYHFGSGLNSFNTLKHLNVKFVKLDGTFIKALYDNEKDAKEKLTTITKALHGQGKLTIIPFVEDARILPVLYQAGVNYIQGYYIQSPAPVLDYDFSGHEESL